MCILSFTGESVRHILQQRQQVGILPFALFQRVGRGLCRIVGGGDRMRNDVRRSCGVPRAAAGGLRGWRHRSTGGFVCGKRGGARVRNAHPSVRPAPSSKDGGVSAVVRRGALTGALGAVTGKANDRAVVIQREFNFEQLNVLRGPVDLYVYITIPSMESSLLSGMKYYTTTITRRRNKLLHCLYNTASNIGRKVCTVCLSGVFFV